MISREGGLCWECKEYARGNNVIILPWDHCIHEPKERPKCYCGTHLQVKGLYINIGDEAVKFNFCPQCGKEI